MRNQSRYTVNSAIAFRQQTSSVSLTSTGMTNKNLSCTRDRATLRVIEYFTNSLEIIRSDTVTPY